MKRYIKPRGSILSAEMQNSTIRSIHEELNSSDPDMLYIRHLIEEEGDPAVLEDIYDIAVQDPELEEMLYYLATNTSTPENILKDLVKNTDIDIRKAARRSLKLRKDPREIDYQRYRKDIDYVYDLGNEPDELRKYADHPSWLVRFHVARNQYTPDDVVEKLLHDPNADVRYAATKPYSRMLHL